jgi:hypothetical protein
MALSQKHRASIYTSLEHILGQEEAEALLSQFPSRDLDEPVTKEFVRAEISDVRAELHTQIAGVRTELAGLRADMSDRFRQHTMWIAATNVVAVTTATVLSRLVG